MSLSEKGLIVHSFFILLEQCFEKLAPSASLIRLYHHIRIKDPGFNDILHIFHRC
jgi:hypothetical protein